MRFSLTFPLLAGLLALAPVVPGCSDEATNVAVDAPHHTTDGNGERDAAPDASGDAAADAQADAPVDAPVDTPFDCLGDAAADVSVDVATEPTPDTTGDTATDIGIDANPDAPHDAGPDVTADAAADAGADGGTPPLCAAAGGFCTEFRWEVCPAGFEPAAGDGNQDCPGGAWCCVPAPPSECSDSSPGNCLEGPTCPSCWMPATGAPACEPGRICCEYICD